MSTKLKILSKILLLSTISLVPLLNPTLDFGFESIKTFIFIGLVIVGGILFCLGNGGKVELKFGSIKKVGATFLFILLISSLGGADFSSSLYGREPYYQGFILYFFLFIFSLLVSVVDIPFKSWVTLLKVSTFLVSLIALKDWLLLHLFNIYVPTYSDRVISTFGQPNFYAGFLLVALPFTLYSGKWSYLLIPINILAILASESRTAILLLPLVLWIWALGKIKNKLKAWGIMAVFLIILASSLFVSFKSSTGILWQEITRPYEATLMAQANPSDSVEKRYFIWPIIYKLIQQNPFSGYGLENIGLSFGEFFSKNKHAFFEENLNPSSVLIRLKDLSVDRSHNYTLDLLMFSGLFGLLSWGFLICVLIKKVRSSAILSSLLLYLIWIQFQNQSVVHLIYFWWLIGGIDKGLSDGAIL